MHLLESRNTIALKAMINVEKILNNTFIYDDIDELSSWIASQHYSKVAILGDSNTIEKCLPILDVGHNFCPNAEIIEVDPGEQSKSMAICEQIWRSMMDLKMDRTSLLINLGGGVITDLGGFIAGTFKRGIDYVNIPTSLMAMVDASIGNKTGINFLGVKNQLGMYLAPKKILIHHQFLKTLGHKDWVSGYAEIIKHALIFDTEYFDQIELAIQLKIEEMNPIIIQRSIEIKQHFVKTDPMEQKERKKLNFGHTFGHALETRMIERGTEITHGAAVAAGIICESFLSSKNNNLSKEDLSRIVRCISTLFTPLEIDQGDFEALFEIMLHDKKNTKNNINCTLLTKIGSSNVNCIIRKEDIFEALAYYYNYCKSYAS